MPSVRKTVQVPVSGSITPDLRPYDRFGGNGGAVRIRSTVVAAGLNAITETIFVGSELVQDQGIVPIESAAGRGPDQFSLGADGRGAPGDPITITYRNLTATARDVTFLMEIENA